MLFQNVEYAEKEHPEIRLVTNHIDEVYVRVAVKFPELLHPNLKEKEYMLPYFGPIELVNLKERYHTKEANPSGVISL